MKRENVEQRLLHLVHHNWTAVAEEMIEDGTAKGFFSERLGQNVSTIARWAQILS
jgi:hypothetical protein